MNIHTYAISCTDLVIVIVAFMNCHLFQLRGLFG